VIGGSLSTVLSRVREEEEIRGEYTLVVEGCEKRKEGGEIGEDVEAMIDGMLKTGGVSVRDMARAISSEAGLDYRIVYKGCIERKRKLST
jgi:hypothetical protein